MTSTYFMGDIHGQYDKLVTLLQKNTLIDDDLRWSGGSQHLWFAGDFFDRGPYGTKSLQLVMDLEKQAEADGGLVNTVIGNHDLLFIASCYIGDSKSGGPGGTFRDEWKYFGGSEHDLEMFTDAHYQWLCERPAMVFLDDILFCHADAPLYFEFGNTVDEVNQNFQVMLRTLDPTLVDATLGKFGIHYWYYRDDDITERALECLKQFGGKRIVHGHSPIHRISGGYANQVTEPFTYAINLCTNIDGCLYAGGQGFLLKVEHESNQ